MLVTTRLSPPKGRGGGILVRTGWLTPYLAETIVREALRAGHGARLDLAVAPIPSHIERRQLEDRFAWLAGRGVHVNVVALRDGLHGNLAARIAMNAEGRRPS